MYSNEYFIHPLASFPSNTPWPTLDGAMFPPVQGQEHPVTTAVMAAGYKGYPLLRGLVTHGSPVPLPMSPALLNEVLALKAYFDRHHLLTPAPPLGDVGALWCKYYLEASAGCKSTCPNRS